MYSLNIYEIRTTILVIYDRPTEMLIYPFLATTTRFQSGGHVGSSKAQIYNDNIKLSREAIDEGYETMISASSTDSDDNEADDVDVDATLNQNESLQGHELIRRYCLRSLNTEEVMISNSDYVQGC